MKGAVSLYKEAIIYHLGIQKEKRNDYNLGMYYLNLLYSIDELKDKEGLGGIDRELIDFINSIQLDEKVIPPHIYKILLRIMKAI